MAIAAAPYEAKDVEKDPLQCCVKPERRWLVRCPGGWHGQFFVDYNNLYAKRLQDMDAPVSVHIVVGPDLMKEKGFLPKKK